MSFPRYPEYKDSGVDWLGEVPAHWEVNQLKHAYSVLGGSTPSSSVPEYWDGDIVWVTPADLSKLKSFEIVSSIRTITDAGLASCGTNLLPVGSIVLSTRAPIGSLGIAGVELCTNQGCKGLVPQSEQCSLFGAYLLAVMGGELNIQGRGTTFLELSGEALGAVKTPLPPESEQACIAAFLDRETAKIDALVAEQQNLIALLKEKRQALISHAVTKGLDPDVPMKDSGVAWLGEVPAHWRVCALRRAIAKIEQGWSPDCHARPAEAGEWGVLKAGCVNGGKYRPAENKALPSELLPDESYCVKVGDVLMSRASGSPDLVGSTALVGETPGRLMLSDKIFRLRLEIDVDPAFFVAMLNARALRVQIEQALSGGNGLANNLPQSNLLAFICALPPEEEQVAIAARLNRDIQGLDQLMAEAESTISLLIERRAALISAAVTGKIDVRHLAVASTEPAPEPA